MGQVELFVGKGDGRLKAHLVCPDKGICLEKVISRSRFGHRLIRKFVVSFVEVETSKVDSRGQIPSTIDQCATVLLNCVQEKGMDVGAFFAGFVPRDRRIPYAPTDVRLHARPAGCFMLAGPP